MPSRASSDVATPSQPPPPPLAAAAAAAATVTSNPSGPPRSSTGRHAIPACDRCRSFKKKCSRTFPVCALCANAGQKCSYSNPTSSAEGQAIQLGARVQWLTRYINDNLLAGTGQSIDSIETGSDIASLLGDATANGSGPGSQFRGPHERDAVPKTPPPDLAASGSIGQPIFGNNLSPHQAHGSLETRVNSNNSNSVTPPLDNASVAASGSHASYRGSVHADESSVGHYITSGGHSTLPADAAARRFVDAYFRNVNRAYPFVDQRKVLEDLDRPDLRSRRRDARTTLLYLVMAIGCTTLERAGQVSRGTSRRFDVNYPDIIQECLSRECIESVQILVLLALYSLFDPAGTSSYSIVGICARQAILLGLSRRSADEKSQDPAEVELRHRLYWSIFVLDRMMAVSQGLPVALTDGNADVPLPGLTVEEFASPERTMYARNLQTSRHVIQLRQLEDKILRYVHFARHSTIADTSPSDRRATLSNIRSEIEDWYSSGCLMSPMEPDNVPIHSSITWLSARYYHLLLLLYYPNHFNNCAGGVPRQEVLQFVRKQLQSTSALFQQRQLPLNRVTLCRLLPLCIVLMHDFSSTCKEAAACGDTTNFPYSARDEVAVLISILEAFPEAWVSAHQAAQLIRQFAGIISGGGLAYYSQQAVYPMGGAAQNAASKADLVEAVQPCIAGMNSLMQDMLGKTTCFQFVENPADDSEMTKASLQQQQQQTLSPQPSNRNMMHLPQMSVGEDQVINYGWGPLDVDFL